MATAEQIASLRLLINQTEDAEPYTSDSLNTRIDAAGGNLEALAAEIWTQKAASYADLVDVQEGSSRRALGKLYEQALAMAAQFGEASGASRSSRVSRTRPIERQ